jgi:hypothetical protein
MPELTELTVNSGSKERLFVTGKRKPVPYPRHLSASKYPIPSGKASVMVNVRVI